MEDAGVYICRVTNGFGSIALNFTLIVIGKHSPDLRLLKAYGSDGIPYTHL